MDDQLRTDQRTTRRPIRKTSRRRGQSIVEFAIVVPILLTMLIGIMEFGWLIKNNLQIANAAREGARAASLGRTTSEITARVQNSIAPLSAISPNGSVIMRWSDTNGADAYPFAITDSGTQNAVLPGKLIKITVTAKHPTLTGFFPMLRNRSISAYATMRRE